MIPLRDNIPSRTTPIVNYGIIAICGLVFYFQLQEQAGGSASLVERYGMIPARVLHPDEPIRMKERVPAPLGRGYVERERQVAEAAVNPWLTLLTCVFLHGGWLHFLGNMWFLYIFGDNVEDRLGHVGYVVFYLGSGVAASAAHLASAPGSTVPTIGASGAIAGVMGAYLVLYPRAMVLSILPIFFFIQIIVLPAPVYLGIWFLLQFLQGTVAVTSAEAGGVAWWAHIGGFAVGVGAAFLLKTTGIARPPVQRVRANADHPMAYRYRRHDT